MRRAALCATFGALAAIAGACTSGCSALGLFDGAPAVTCLVDLDCRVPGLVEDGCVHFVCEPQERICVGMLADGDGDGQAPIGCAASFYADTGVPTDCDDTDVTVYDAALELCGGGDNDCDGTIDEQCVTPLIAVGADHACFLGGDTFICWGGNDRGQLGTGSVEYVGPHPRSVAGLDPRSIRAITAGDGTTCATLMDDRVYCWGDNEQSQLALPPPTRRVEPTEVPALFGATSLVLGTHYGCAAFGAEIRCWGDNTSGTLGADRTGGPTPEPIAPTAAMSSFAPMAAGPVLACAQSVSEVWCWGSGGAGCAAATDAWRPCIGVAGIGASLSLSVGSSHACATSGTEVVCWGSNVFGQLGGMPTFGNRVVTFEGVMEANWVAAGGQHSCAIVGGHMYCWGSNDAQQAGLEEHVSVFRPALVHPDIDDFIAVHAGTAFNCALRRTGVVLCWGSNAAGQLGGTTSGLTSAALISPLSTWHREGER